MPCHLNTSVSSFRMFGQMLCYLISALITNNAGVGFNFQEFDGECHSVADYFDDSLLEVVVDVVGVQFCVSDLFSNLQFASESFHCRYLSESSHE